MTDLPSKSFNPFTLIYLTQNNKVLLMKRNSSKKLLASKLVGLGGKIEKDEDILTSAKREFLEETGLELLNPIFKGTYTWIDNNFIGISHLIVSKEYKGRLLEESSEGILAWYKINELDDLQDLAAYQKNFLPEILKTDNYVYTGIGIFDNDTLITYTDTKEYFRKK